MARRGVIAIVLGLVVASAAAVLGRGAPAPAPGERIVVIPTWGLEIHGRVVGAVTLPAHIEDKLVERSGARAKEYTLRAPVPIPPEMRGRELTLAIPWLVAQTSMIADDHRVYAIDAPTQGGYRESGPQRFRIPGERSDTDSLEIELIVRNEWTPSGWLDTVPRLSATLDGDRAFNVVRTVDRASGVFGLAATVMLAIAYGALFLTDRRRVAYGWQLVQAASTSSYPMFFLGLTQLPFGTRDLAVVSVLLAVAAVANVKYMHHQFALGTMPRIWWLAIVVAIVVAVFAGGPFTAVRYLVPVALLPLLAASIFNSVLLVRAVRARTRPSGLVLSTIGWPIAFAAAGGDMGLWLGRGELFGSYRLASAGMTLVALLQAVALMREHVQSLRRSDELNVELAARVRALESSNEEIQTLNDELRRQIGARSQQLAQSLGQMGDVTASRMPLTPGQLVEDRYKIVRELGAGGMGAVYLVERVKDGRRFALKVHQRGDSGAALARLAREAQLASQVAHPNIVTIVDVDVSQSGVLYIVMEFVDGPSLADLHDRFGDATWALPLLRQIAEGLAAIHAASIVHRDLKPGNVLVAGGVAKIADFGISTQTAGILDDPAVALAETVDAARDSASRIESGSLTATGAILGTPLYMAPEAARGARGAQPASDLFSFGVIAFEMLTGTLPFDGAAVTARLRGRSTPPPPSLTALRPEIDPGMAAIVARCLSPSPAERPSARDVADAFGDAISGATGAPDPG